MDEAARGARTGWTGQLWADIDATYSAILTHPFIEGLTTGDLPPDAFFYFVSQDAEYVREFGKVIALLGNVAVSQRRGIHHNP